MEEISDNLEKIYEQTVQNSSHWRGNLTSEQYSASEIALDKKLSSLGMQMRRFVLEETVNGRRSVVCSMEALQRVAYVKRAGYKPTPVANYVLDCVYTPQEYRGNGYALKLVEEVCEHLSRDGVCLITLWSDIGDYYTRVGFVPTSLEKPYVLEWAPQVSNYETICWPAEASPLGMKESQAIAVLERTIVLAAIDVMSERDGISRAVILPSEEILDQAQWRALYLSENCYNSEPPTVYGARTANGSIAWAYQMGEKAIYVISITGPMLEMVILFQTAIASASKIGYRVVLYDAELFSIGSNPPIGQFCESLASAGFRFELRERSVALPYHRTNALGDLRLEFPGRYSYF